MDEFNILKTCTLCSSHRVSLLGSIELGRDGDDDAATIIDVGDGRECLDNLGRELLRSEILLEVLAVIGHQRTHGALELLENVRSSGAAIPFLCSTEHLVGLFVGCRITDMDDTLAVDRHDRWNSVLLGAAFLDDGYAILHDGDG